MVINSRTKDFNPEDWFGEQDDFTEIYDKQNFQKNQKRILMYNLKNDVDLALMTYTEIIEDGIKTEIGEYLEKAKNEKAPVVYSTFNNRKKDNKKLLKKVQKYLSKQLKIKIENAISDFYK